MYKDRGWSLNYICTQSYVVAAILVSLSCVLMNLPYMVSVSHHMPAQCSHSEPVQTFAYYVHFIIKTCLSISSINTILSLPLIVSMCGLPAIAPFRILSLLPGCGNCLISKAEIWPTGKVRQLIGQCLISVFLFLEDRPLVWKGRNALNALALRLEWSLQIHEGDKFTSQVAYETVVRLTQSPPWTQVNTRDKIYDGTDKGQIQVEVEHTYSSNLCRFLLSILGKLPPLEIFPQTCTEFHCCAQSHCKKKCFRKPGFH